MSIDVLITASIEAGLNKLLRADGDAIKKIASLDGKSLQINVKELPLPLYFIFSSQVDVLAKYSGDVDCCIDITLSTLSKLQDSATLMILIKNGSLDMHGDPMIVSQFGLILKELNIDWEDKLSHYVGDIAAHKFFYGIKSSQQWIKRNVQRTNNQLAEYLVEEVRLAPNPLEIVDFCDDVTVLMQQLQDIEKRIVLLARKESS